MLQKQSIPINFSQGLDTKTDSKQVVVGRFLRLVNTIFNKGGLLQKRNGNRQLPSLPDPTANYTTTLNGNLTALGNTISAYSSGSASWVSKGTIKPLSVSTLPLIRNSVNQTQADSVISSNGLVCTVYTQVDASGTTYRVAIADSTTGQNILSPRVIPVASGVVTGAPRVFLLGNFFVLVFRNVITAVNHLQYVAISSINPSTIGPNVDLAANFIPATTLSFDCFVTGQNMYVAYNTTSGGQSIKVTYLTVVQAAAGGAPASPVTFAGEIATIMSVTADQTNPASPIIWVTYFDSAGGSGSTLAVDRNLNTVLAPTVYAISTLLNLSTAAQNGILSIFYEISNNYSYDGAIPSHIVGGRTVTQGGAPGTPMIILRSVGLASKAFIVDGVIYFLAAYQSPYQSTYFLVNGSTSTSASPVIVAKIAYQNGGGYLTTGTPNVTVTGNVAQIPYLFKDQIQAVNKNTNVPAGSQINGIYSQLGVNLASFDIDPSNIDTAEIAGNLHLSGGFLGMYDGYLPVEHNFFLYPDSVEITTATGSGGLIAQDYYYQVTYEWQDNQGNIYRSAPSIPVKQTTTTASSTNTINVPTLRLTAKVSNLVKIVVYRWSTAQQVYYQVTSLTSPTLNSTTADSVAIVDAASDATILGNNILYTNGGVVEDVNAPASNIMTLFDTRLWLVDAEDKNLLWFSKQVIEATPVEMSDLFTFFVAPTTAAQGSTGPIRSLAPMDDKLVIFKSNAILYINGVGPDNTGANNNYSQPIFITSTVGCVNQKSICFTPNGLMFQSDKGIWLLGRDLSTSYIGSPVEDLTLGTTVSSAINIPETNQVRFTLSSGVTLMYDYFYNQWGSFENIPAVSSCIFQELHTFINDAGECYQENPGSFLDGSVPVLMSFTTSWFQLAGLQGYQRAYFFFLLGQYISPHILQLGIAYDYDTTLVQNTVIRPTNFSSSVPSSFGVPSAPFGASGNIEQWRVFLDKQRCQSFQITLNEFYDSSMGAAAGGGLTLSGLNVIAGFKRAYKSIGSANSVGGSSR